MRTVADKNTFTAFLPFSDMKVEKSSKDGKTEMRIAGIASTSSKDREGETIPQSALDISELLSSGFVNFDHNNEKIIGYPDKTKTRFTSEGLYIESILLSGVPLAEEIYNTAKALQESGSDRKFGYSIEGKITARDPINPSIIRKAKVINVAVTPTPMNPDCTWDVVKKSFTASKGDSCPVIIPESLDDGLTTLDMEAQNQRKSGVIKSLVNIYNSCEDKNVVNDTFATLSGVENFDFTLCESIVLLQLMGVSFQDALRTVINKEV